MLDALDVHHPHLVASVFEELADWYAEDVQIRLGLATEDDFHPMT